MVERALTNQDDLNLETPPRAHLPRRRRHLLEQVPDRANSGRRGKRRAEVAAGCCSRAEVSARYAANGVAHHGGEEIGGAGDEKNSDAPRDVVRGSRTRRAGRHHLHATQNLSVARDEV